MVVEVERNSQQETEASGGISFDRGDLSRRCVTLALPVILGFL
jgi:hypothetical protein